MTEMIRKFETNFGLNPISTLSSRNTAYYQDNKNRVTAIYTGHPVLVLAGTRVKNWGGFVGAQFCILPA